MELQKTNTIGEIRAWDKVMIEKRAGRFPKPDKCEYCGKRTTALCAHHNDYNNPLQVIWVCRKCHGEIHRQERGSRIHVSGTVYIADWAEKALKADAAQRKWTVTQIVREIIENHYSLQRPVENGN